MGVEIELKLDLTPEAARELRRAAPFGAPQAVIEQHATYFDTDDRRLRAAGLSLRVRRAGEKRVQTLKAAGGGAAGLQRRGEWERPVAGDTPDLDDPVFAERLHGIDPAVIRPLFEVAVERSRWTIEEGGARVELVQDRGRALAAGREDAFDEVEIERIDGDPAALFAIARRIDAAAPVRLGLLTKAARGERLLEAAPRSVKAAAPQLDGVTDAGGLVQAIAAECLRQFRLNEAILIAGRGPQALHQARVAIRRLRSALSVFRRLLASPALDRFRDEFRWLAAEFGRPRDLDVLIGTMPDGALRDRVATAREESYDALLATLDGARARHLILDFAEWMSLGAWTGDDRVRRRRERDARDFAEKALDRLRRRVRDMGRALEDGDDEARHELRKAAKRMRYSAEFFAPLLTRKRERKRHARFLDALEALQDELGALNDLATAPALLARFADPDAPDVPLPDTADKARLIARAATAHRRFAEAKRSWR